MEHARARNKYPSLRGKAPSHLPILGTAQPAVSVGVAGCQASWSLLLQAVLSHPLGGQLSQHILQVVGVRVAMACHIAVHLCLVVDLVPHYCVSLACGARRPHCEDKSPFPGHLQQLQDLPQEEGGRGGVEREKEG